MQAENYHLIVIRVPRNYIFSYINYMPVKPLILVFIGSLTAWKTQNLECTPYANTQTLYFKSLCE